MGPADEVHFDLLRFTWEEEAIMLARLLVAAAVGAILGLERYHARKHAGIRTVTMVSVGAAAFALVSLYGFEGGDTARVAAQVASGIGFLGAGTILRQGADVQGLTTAAAIWVAAALGLAAGVGLYVLAIGGAILAVAVLALLPHESAEVTLDPDGSGQAGRGDEEG